MTVVRLLRDAGALPYIQHAITLLSFESANEVWRRTMNPHNADYSPAAALLALGGRIGCSWALARVMGEVGGHKRRTAMISVNNDINRT